MLPCWRSPKLPGWPGTTPGPTRTLPVALGLGFTVSSGGGRGGGKSALRCTLLGCGRDAVGRDGRGGGAPVGRGCRYCCWG